MFSILKNIFGKKESTQTFKAIEKNNDDYLIEELNKSPFIKKESFDIVLQHLQGKLNLAKKGEKLSADEKKSLGLNSRLSVTHALIEVLTDLGLKQKNPKDVLSNISNKARQKEYRIDTLKKFVETDIKHFTLFAAGDERDCPWCKSNNNKKMSVNVDINTLIEEHCTCEGGSRSVLQAVVNF